jgi:hypothetical protein
MAPNNSTCSLDCCTRALWCLRFLIDRLADLARSSEYVPHNLWSHWPKYRTAVNKVINFAAIESLIISRLIQKREQEL